MLTDRRLRSERGTAMVEFALVAPLLLLVLVGIFEFGRTFNYWIHSTHLANEGARWADVDKVPNNDLLGYVCSQAATTEMQRDLEVTVTFSHDGGPFVNPPSATLVSGDAVRVVVTKTMSFPGVSGMLNLLGGPGAGTLELSGTSTMALDVVPPRYSGGYLKCS